MIDEYLSQERYFLDLFQGRNDTSTIKENFEETF